MSRPPDQVAVVGAGITGLVAAHRLARILPDADVTVLEASDHIGGKIRTSPIAGIVVDEAADAFLARVPEGIALVRELGLEDQLVSPAERRAFVYRHGALHRFPEGLTLGVPTDLDTLRATGLVSDAGLERAAEDLTMPADAPGAPAPGDDETVGALVRRRLGDEVFEAFVGPLLSGVNAGDADELSVAAGAPQFAAAVRDQPSLILGLRAQREAAAAADPDAPIFFGLRGGTQTLTEALAASLGNDRVRTGSPVGSLHPRLDGGFTIGTPTGVLDADAVILATPTFAAATLVEPFAPDLAADLDGLDWSSVVLVTFAVRRAAIDHPLDGSGFLVSEGEGLLMTACSFGSSKWAHWADGGGTDPDDLVILRVSAGRHHDPRAWALDDDRLCAVLVDELATTIGLHRPPIETRVSRWERALPQYRPGHLERARAWKQAAAAAAPGLFLAGAGYFGLGLPACIRDANDTASRVAELLV